MEIDTKEIELGEKLHGEMECLFKPDGSSRFSISKNLFNLSICGYLIEESTLDYCRRYNSNVCCIWAW